MYARDVIIKAQRRGRLRDGVASQTIIMIGLQTRVTLVHNNTSLVQVQASKFPFSEAFLALGTRLLAGLWGRGESARHSSACSKQLEVETRLHSLP